MWCYHCTHVVLTSKQCVIPTSAFTLYSPRSNIWSQYCIQRVLTLKQHVIPTPHSPCTHLKAVHDPNTAFISFSPWSSTRSEHQLIFQPYRFPQPSTHLLPMPYMPHRALTLQRYQTSSHLVLCVLNGRSNRVKLHLAGDIAVCHRAFRHTVAWTIGNTSEKTFNILLIF